MRLLNTTKRKLEEFGSNDIPLYAILSHTWRKHEITFQDIESDDVEQKEEYEKIRKTCSMAADHGFEYVWIDTCCIDKTSSAELSEVLNSMYRWYGEAEKCYVYLADVPQGTVNHLTGAVGDGFRESRWFTRGWTLQELIAPSTIIFLDSEWQEIGTKSSLQSIISDITSIPSNILLGGDLEYASIAQRMSWASNRETTRVEDLAYCLMGIFGVNMPMLYGEGERAFIRLQEEIMKVSDDHSLFAWESDKNYSGLLASSPAAFSHSSDIIPFNPSSALSGAITVNNKGIHLKIRFKDRTSFRGVGLAILPCKDKEKEVAIYVRAISETKEYFIRTQSDKLELLNLNDLNMLKCYEKSICVQQERLTHKNLSSLPRAAAYGDKATVKLLLEKGAQLEAKDIVLGQTPLSSAAENGHEAVVKLLLEEGAELESKDNFYDQTPLLWSAANGHEAVVKLLVEEGAQLESKDKSGQTPLSWAAAKGHEAVVKLLVEKSAQVESKNNSYGQTPLSRAARNGHEAVVKLLLERGAQLESRDKSYGQTPLSWAAENGHEAVVKLLLERGAQLESRDSAGRAPLLWAAKNGHEAVVKLLLEEGAEPETKEEDNYGQTPLIYAAGNGHDEVVKLLLEKGAQLESKGIVFGQTALSRAAMNGHEAVVKLLLEKGSQLETKDNSGQTPLLYAARKGHDAVVKLLLGRGAELETKDNSGQTPLSYAVGNRHEAVVKLLLKKGALKHINS